MGEADDYGRWLDGHGGRVEMHDHGNCQRCDDLEARAREVLRTGEETERELATERILLDGARERIAALEADLAAMRGALELAQPFLIAAASVPEQTKLGGAISDPDRPRREAVAARRASKIALSSAPTRLQPAAWRLTEALGILTRACEAGAYVGRTSPAVVQARAVLDGNAALASSPGAAFPVNNVVACVNCKRPVEVTALNAVRCEQCASPGAGPGSATTEEDLRELMKRILTPGCPHPSRPIVAIEPPYLFEGACRTCLVERGAKAIERFTHAQLATAREVVEALDWHCAMWRQYHHVTSCSHCGSLLARPEVKAWAGR